MFKKGKKLHGFDKMPGTDDLEKIKSGERRIVALEQQGQETHTRIQSIDQAARDLLAMFEALLKALTGENTGRAA